MIVAIHQPNYAPWLGYFHKIAQSDVFIFLDDVQYPKNGYTNRVQILHDGAAKWLTQPVSARLGMPINEVTPAKPTWRRAHLDTLRTAYHDATHFKDIWPVLNDIYDDLPEADIAAINRRLIEELASRVGLTCRFEASSDFALNALKGTDRLVALIEAITPGATYLSGKGGANYQDAEVFETGGISLRYSDYKHPQYAQNGDEFVPGLSILDAVFHLGWRQAGDLAASQN